MNKLRKLFAAAMAAAIMLVLTACNEDKPDYEKLKTDIIGVWCDIDGPEYVEDGEDSYYRLYEFTSDGQLIYHMPRNMMSYYNDASYEITDDIMTVSGGGRCRISIENDILTMIQDNGSSDYRRMTLDEVTSYGAVCRDDGLYKQQESLIVAYQSEAGLAMEMPGVETD